MLLARMTHALATGALVFTLSPARAAAQESGASQPGAASRRDRANTPSLPVPAAAPAGSTQTGQLCLLQYNDANGSGARDPGEVVLPGWGFTISAGSNASAIVAQGTTNAAGLFCAPVPAGPYLIVPAGQPGWSATLPAGQLATFAPGIGVMTQPFGARQDPPGGGSWPATPGRVCIMKYEDVNANGAWASNEPSHVPGFSFTLRDSNGIVAAPVTEVSLGPGLRAYCTQQVVPPGQYTITETPVPGWINTQPGGNATQSIVVTSMTTTNVRFGNQRRPVTAHPGRLCITKYADVNGNGARDPGEVALSGWQFTIRNSSNAAVAQGTTDASGRYCRNLPAGSYAAAETPRPGWVLTDPAGGGARPAVIVSAQTLDIAFGNSRLARGTGSRPDLRIDTAFNRSLAPRPPGAILGIFVTTAQSTALPVGAPITIQGSLQPAASFSAMTVLTPGWTCTGSWGGFQCSRTLGSASTAEVLELHTTYPTSLAGSPFTYSATVSIAGTPDANPANNARTITDTLP
jgi:hypothetical protein